MPSRLMKKTSLIAAFTLGTVIGGGSAAWAAAPSMESAAPQDTALFTPMSDAEAMGAGCFVAGSASLAAAYALGPTELMMLATGAVIVPSSSSLLFLALGGILGAGVCGVGAALTPTVMWAVENSSGIKANLKPESREPNPAVPTKANLTGDTIATQQAAVVRPMNEGEIQGTGCLLGILGLGAITLAAAPTEIVMLAAGGVTVPSKTSLLMMGILGTVVPASCTIGSAASLPLVALYKSFDTNAIGQRLASMLGWERWSPAPVALPAGVEGAKIGGLDSLPSTTIAEPRVSTALQIGQQEPMGSMLPLASMLYSP
ncbi:conserved membrane hypothetical protein [Gammaproteobacteria bacterium]